MDLFFKKCRYEHKQSQSNVYISLHYVWTCINICILHSSVQTYRHRSTFRRRHEDRMRRTSIANRLPQGCMCFYVSTSINFQKHYQVWDPSDMNRLFYQSKLGSNKLAWYNTLLHNLKYSYKVPYKVQSICSPNLGILWIKKLQHSWRHGFKEFQRWKRRGQGGDAHRRSAAWHGSARKRTVGSPTLPWMNIKEWVLWMNQWP